MTITKQQLIDKYNEVYSADNGITLTFEELTKDQKVEALLQFITAISGGGGSGGDASAANQEAVQADAGSDATKAVSIQGITDGKVIPVSLTTLPDFTSTPTVNLGTLNGAATSTKQDNLIALFPSTLGTKTSALSFPVTLSSDGVGTSTAPLIAATNTYFQTVIATKSANANTYAAGDVWGSKLELTAFGIVNGSFFLTGIDLVFSLATLPTGLGSFKLFLFDSEPAAIVDNGAFTLHTSSLTPDGITLSSLTVGTNATGATSATTAINRLFKRSTGNLWIYLVTQGGYTPSGSLANTISISLKGFEA